MNNDGSQAAANRPYRQNRNSPCLSIPLPMTGHGSSSTATPVTTTPSPSSSPPTACDLAGITTVAGNAPLDRTTHNALVMRELLGIDIPVHAGAARPLVAEPVAAADVHGASGLDGSACPNRPAADSDDAVAFIIESCRSRPGTWIVAVGPLTNVALALRRAPDLADTIAGISVMGGGTFGNRTAVGEFNIWADPEAAAPCSPTADRW